MIKKIETPISRQRVSKIRDTGITHATKEPSSTHATKEIKSSPTSESKHETPKIEEMKEQN